jgi:hypothetical protein
VGKTERDRRLITLGDESVWPAIIIIALAVVMAVNAVFIYIAVTGAEDVAPSYVEGER